MKSIIYCTVTYHAGTDRGAGAGPEGVYHEAADRQRDRAT